MDTFPPTARTKLHRRASRGSHDRAQIEAILDEGLVCHVGFTDAHGPVVIPTAYARDGQSLLLHGAPASRLMKQAGQPLCITVTLLDGLVIARSAMHHSMNYRAVMVFGTSELVTDRAEKLEALAAIVEHLVPGRRPHTRGPNEAELVATAVLRVPLVEVSAKIRTGGPIDDEEDLALPHWAGVLPLAQHTGAPIAAEGIVDAAPHHVAAWQRPTR